MNDKNKKISDGTMLEKRLPELTKEQIAWAENPKQQSWATETLSLGTGYCWLMPDHGLSMQVYDNKTFRLLTVVDHDYCIMMVSYVKATLESVGITLDTSQVVMRIYAPSEESHKDSNESVMVTNIEVI